MRRLVLLLIFITAGLSSATGQFRKLSRMVKRGNFENALQYAERKMATMNARKFNRNKLQRWHLTLGKIHYVLGDYIQSEKEFKNSFAFVENRLTSHKRLKLPDFDVMDELSFFYVSTGNFQQGRALIDRSLKLRIRKLNRNNPTNYRPYLPLGMLFFFQNQYDSARYYLTIYQKQIRNSNYTGFLDINRYADTYQVLADIEMKTGDWKRAQKYARKSVRLQRHPWTKKQVGKNHIGRVKALNSLSAAYRARGKFKRATAYNRKAFSLYRRKYDKESYLLVPLYLNKAWLAAERGNVDSVRVYLGKSIALQQDFISNSFNHLSEYEKENYQGRLRAGFHEINSVMLKLYRENRTGTDDPFWPEILNYIINTKALILSESNRVIENLRRNSDPDVKILFAQWRRLKNEWAFLSGTGAKRKQADIAALQNQIIAVEKEMAAKALSMTEEKPPVDWKQLRPALAKDEAAIEIARVDTGLTKDSAVVYLAFVIRSDDVIPRIVVLEDGDQLEKRYIRYYFNAIHNRITDTISYNRFWKPFQEALKGVKRVYVSADGVFHLVSADILKNPETQKLVGEDLSVVNVTNIAHLLLRKEGDFTFTNAGLFGSPDFTGYSSAEMGNIGFRETIAPLPGTAEEISEVDKLLRSNKISSSTFVESNASEQNLVSQQGFDVLHLATHGFFNSTAYGSEAMLGSGLVLGKDPARMKDGILTAYEASTLNLDNTRLVVLSACKTGLGAVKEGEGVYGLQRAFEVAGVDHILMTLWEVDDAVTREFMVDFYRELILAKNVQLAFRKAQSRVREKHPPVFYWGAYKLISAF